MSFLLGLFLFADGVVALLFFLLFHWIGTDIIGLIGAAIIGVPIWIWLLREEKKEEKRAWLEKERQIREREAEEKARIEEARRNTVCQFTDGITQAEFDAMAYRVAERIKRLQIRTDGLVVEGEVESQSGISIWSFEVDFNDFGHITGAWWMIYRENYDSSIPNRYAELLQRAIEEKLRES